tara:strand:- start:4101 stop:5504 length:1404 start_codon:yes stop_codon:yes gene_type:complete
MNFDYVIIGTGPAGCVIANQLSKSGFKIALIDRAINDKSPGINDFFCPYVENSPNNYTPVYSNELGGNSVLWHSKIYLVSKNEFDKSYWGFSYENLSEYSKKLSYLFKTDFNSVNKSEKGIKFFLRHSVRGNFRSIYKFLQIDKDQNITLFKGYCPINLEHDKNEDRLIKSVYIKNFKNEKLILNINKKIIFCAGGLGNPHLLLNLLRKKNKNLGRYLSDHTHVNLGKVEAKKIDNFIKIAKPNIKMNLGVDDKKEVAAIFENGKYFLGIQLDYKNDPFKKIRRYYLQIKSLKIRKLINFFYFFFLKLNGLFYKLGLIFGKYYKYSFELYFSQNPSEINFVDLSKNTDKFGLQKININWKLSENDIENYKILIENAIGRNSSLGNYFKIKNFKKKFFKYDLAGLHPSCTTKIGINEKEGVVDKNLKLFEYKNIYVCGSSVFPLNGFTNPTWTIMCLALRLSQHLKNE